MRIIIMEVNRAKKMAEQGETFINPKSIISISNSILGLTNDPFGAGISCTLIKLLWIL